MSKSKAKQKGTGIRCQITPNGELLIYGIVGDEFDELDAKTIIKQVQALGDLDELTVRINSGGGFVAEGLAIYNFLKSYPGKVNVFIDGLAASMASAIAMAGDVVSMASNALMMVHRPWDIAAGDADQLRKDAAKLDKFEESLVSIYVEKTGKTAAEISAMLDEETWLSADEALAEGFIDEITEEMEAAALTGVDFAKFKHAPQEAMAMTQTAKKTKPTAKEETRAERRRAADILRACDVANLSTEFAQELIDSDLSLDQARAQVIDKWAEAGGPDTRSGISMPGDQSLDNPQFRIKAMSEALACR